MKRGRRYLPVPRSGRRRIGLIGIGLLAAMSLVWQQQATVASFADSELAGATFTAATLKAIKPTVTSSTASSITTSWPAATGAWSTPKYRLDWSKSSNDDPKQAYLGAATGATHSKDGTAKPQVALPFTKVAAGNSEACGVSRGQVYCWGKSDKGGLGDNASPATTPKLITGLYGKVAVDITVGGDFACALAGGSVYCWGLGTSGQLGDGRNTTSSAPVKVSGLSGSITSLTAGDTHACAVAGGDAYCWGNNGSGRLGDGSSTNRGNSAKVLGLEGRTVYSISAGDAHTCAVADGRAFCWGAGAGGQLGNNLTSESKVPVAVFTGGGLMGHSVSAIDAGGAFSCAIADGKAYCWGSGGSGQLGNNSTSNESAPVAVSAVPGTATQISVGSASSCVIAYAKVPADAKVLCWGEALGNGHTADSATAAPVIGSLADRTINSLSVGTKFGCAAGNTPAACWGYGNGGTMGDQSTENNTTPGDVTLKGPVCDDGAVRLADSDPDSDPYCSLVQGTTYRYRLGYEISPWTAPTGTWVEGATGTRGKLTPTATSGSKSVSLSWAAATEPGDSYPEYTVLRSASSSGANPVTLGSTGARTWTDRGITSPSRDFSQVAAGGAHTCAIIEHQLYCWGKNDMGQLGIGSTTDQAVPTLVRAFVDKIVSSVSAGGSHTCAIVSDKVYCWGDNSFGQLGNGIIGGMVKAPTSPVSSLGTVSALSAGTNHSCAVNSGKAYCWGLNANGQLGDGGTNDTATAQPVEETRTCGFWLIVCWRWDPVFTNESVTAVAAGGSHTCVINSGSGFCWGLASSGQLGNGSTTQALSAVKMTPGDLSSNANLTYITAGKDHTCALKAKTAYCWGSNSDGQVGNNATLNATTPKKVSSPLDATITSLSAGGTHTCAANGSAAWCWGAGANGRLGNGATSGSRTAVAVSAKGTLSSTISGVAAGGSHGCLVASGEIDCWGAGANGRLGQGGSASSALDSSSALQVDDGPRCLVGATLLGDGSCSAASGTDYYYGISFTLDGKTRTSTGDWSLGKIG